MFNSDTVWQQLEWPYQALALRLEIDDDTLGQRKLQVSPFTPGEGHFEWEMLDFLKIWAYGKLKCEVEIQRAVTLFVMVKTVLML